MRKFILPRTKWLVLIHPKTNWLRELLLPTYWTKWLLEFVRPRTNWMKELVIATCRTKSLVGFALLEQVVWGSLSFSGQMIGGVGSFCDKRMRDLIPPRTKWLVKFILPKTKFNLVLILHRTKWRVCSACKILIKWRSEFFLYVWPNYCWSLSS